MILNIPFIRKRSQKHEVPLMPALDEDIPKEIFVPSRRQRSRDHDDGQGSHGSATKPRKKRSRGGGARAAPSAREDETLRVAQFEDGDDAASESSERGVASVSQCLWMSASDADGPMRQVEAQCSASVVQIMSRSDARRKVMLDALLNHGEF